MSSFEVRLQFVKQQYQFAFFLRPKTDPKHYWSAGDLQHIPAEADTIPDDWEQLFCQAGFQLYLKFLVLKTKQKTHSKHTTQVFFASWQSKDYFPRQLIYQGFVVLTCILNRQTLCDALCVVKQNTHREMFSLYIKKCFANVTHWLVPPQTARSYSLMPGEKIGREELTCTALVHDCTTEQAESH